MGVEELAERASGGDSAADRELTRKAAEGDLEAQRALLSVLVGENVDKLPLEVLYRLELFARLIATRGDPYDIRRLAAVLAATAIRRRDSGLDADTFAEESGALLRELADYGDGPSSDHLASFAGDFPAVWALVEAGQSSFSVEQFDCGKAEPTLGEVLAEALANNRAAAGAHSDGPVRAFLRDWLWRAATALDALLDWAPLKGGRPLMNNGGKQ